MIELKNEILRDGMFTAALGKLEHCPKFPVKVAMNIAKISAQVREQGFVAQAEFTTLLKKYCKLDEKGEIIPDPAKGPNSYQMPNENVGAFEKERDEFEVKGFSLVAQPLKLAELEGTGITPAELVAIEPLIQDDSPPVKLAPKPKVEVAATPAPSH